MRVSSDIAEMSITYAEYRAVRSIISGQATTQGPTTPSESNYDDGPGVTDIDCVVVLQEKVKRVLSQTVKVSGFAQNVAPCGAGADLGFHRSTQM